MSWDIFIQDFPDVASPDDIPEDFIPASLGPRAQVIGRIVDAVPAADFADPTCGLIEGVGWSIEIYMSDDEDCSSVMLAVRGNGDDAVAAIVAIMKGLGHRAIDTQTGGFFDEAAALASFADWRAYRDGSQAGPPPEAPAKRGFFRRLLG